MQSELFSCFGGIVSSLPERSYRLTATELPLLNLAAPGNLRYLHFRLDEHGVAQDNIESVYSCPAALQKGILLAQLKAGPKNHVYIYINRFASRLTFSTRLGSKQEGVETDRIDDAWKVVCQAHPILRTVFISGLAKEGAVQQIIFKRHEPSIPVKQIPRNGPTTSLVIESSEQPPLDPMKPPHHLTLYHESASVVYAVLDIINTAADARSLHAIWMQIAAGYPSGDSVPPRQGRPCSDYVVWVQRNEAEVHQYWKQYLTGTSPCILQQGPSTDLGHGTRKLVVPFNDARRLNLFCQEQSITVAMFTQTS